MGLLISTAACIVVVNLILAQLIIMRFYPAAGARVGLAGLVALVVIAVLCIAYTVRGWRAYLRRPPAA